MKVGIVGHEAAKFSIGAERQAKALIRKLLAAPESAVVSGACPLGGVDVWADEIAQSLGRKRFIFPPTTNSWEGGFKPRNIQIATVADVVHNIVVDVLPLTYRGRRWPSCYHCHTSDHVKSGGCWTARYAQKLGKEAHWHIIGQSSADFLCVVCHQNPVAATEGFDTCEDCQP